MAKGRLVVSVFVDNIAEPIQGAKVHISGNNTEIDLITDQSGKTKIIELEAPDKSYSLEPQTEVQPFSTYNITVTKEGLGISSIVGVQIYDGIESYQDVFFHTSQEGYGRNVTVITPPTLWENGDPKIIENPDNLNPEGKVLPKVIIPGYIIVHDGVPSDTSAPNYYITFTDYIKNVTSSEIYPSWPKETLKANIHAIVSFTLNRIYTEWYLSKGYNFTITSSTAYDQKYTHNRTIFDTISNAVDEVFMEYLTFPDRGYPFLAQYCDGKNVIRKGWLSQWGSKSLGDQGYNSLQIVRYYYGNSIELRKAELVDNLPTSFPGYNLSEGACGEEVRQLQNALNKIRGSYPAIPTIKNANGIFGTDTVAAVKKFQSVFNLPVTGIVNFATWYRISAIYAAVSNMLKGIYG